MSAVRVNVSEARSLAESYATVASAIDESITGLSPLISEAMRLLDRAVHPMFGPATTLATTATDLRSDRDDLQWRLDFLIRNDGAGFNFGDFTFGSLPDWDWETAQAVALVQKIEIAFAEREQGSVFEQERRQGELHNLIAQLAETDNPETIGAIMAGLRQGEPILLAINNAAQRELEATTSKVIGELATAWGVSFGEAEVQFVEMQQDVAGLIALGHSAQDAAQIVEFARVQGFDVDEIEGLARSEGIGLIDAATMLYRAETLSLTVDEVHAFNGLHEEFTALDTATGQDADGLVSMRDIQYVVQNPELFDASTIAAANALWSNQSLLMRLDSSRDNGDVLQGDGHFGADEFDDHLISMDDIESFVGKQSISHILGVNYDAIDIAAKGGTPDGHLSKADFEAFLNNNEGLLTDEEVLAFETVIDAEWYDKGWFEENKRSIALVSAVIAGGALVFFTGGLGTGFSGALITMAATAGAGGAAAVSTTLTINAFSSESDLDDDLVSNGIGGAMAGMGGGGATLGVQTFRLAATSTAGKAAIALGVTSDVTGLAGMGTFDVGLQYAPGLGGDNLEQTKEIADLVSIGTGVTGATLAFNDALFTWHKGQIIDDMAVRFPDWETRNFTPNGVSHADAVDFITNHPVGQQIVDEIAASGTLPLGRVEQLAIEGVMTGVAPPTVAQISEPLVKIAPVGSEVSAVSPYWTTRSELDRVLAEGHDLADVFGLPVGSTADDYVIWEIAPLPGAVGFESTIAPTTELFDLATTTGGATQIYVPDRTMFTPATSTGEAVVGTPNVIYAIGEDVLTVSGIASEVTEEASPTINPDRLVTQE